MDTSTPLFILFLFLFYFYYKVRNIKFDKSKVLTEIKYGTENDKKLFFHVHKIDVVGKVALGGAINL